MASHKCELRTTVTLQGTKEGAPSTPSGRRYDPAAPLLGALAGPAPNSPDDPLRLAIRRAAQVGLHLRLHFNASKAARHQHHHTAVVRADEMTAPCADPDDTRPFWRLVVQHNGLDAVRPQHHDVTVCCAASPWRGS